MWWAHARWKLSGCLLPSLTLLFLPIFLLFQMHLHVLRYFPWEHDSNSGGKISHQSQWQRGRMGDSLTGWVEDSQESCHDLCTHTHMHTYMHIDTNSAPLSFCIKTVATPQRRLEQETRGYFHSTSVRTHTHTHLYSTYAFARTMAFSPQQLLLFSMRFLWSWGGMILTLMN